MTSKKNQCNKDLKQPQNDLPNPDETLPAHLTKSLNHQLVLKNEKEEMPFTNLIPFLSDVNQIKEGKPSLLVVVVFSLNGNLKHLNTHIHK